MTSEDQLLLDVCYLSLLLFDLIVWCILSYMHAARNGSAREKETITDRSGHRYQHWQPIGHICRASWHRRRRRCPRFDNCNTSRNGDCQCTSCNYHQKKKIRSGSQWTKITGNFSSVYYRYNTGILSLYGVIMWYRYIPTVFATPPPPFFRYRFSVYTGIIWPIYSA